MAFADEQTLKLLLSKDQGEIVREILLALRHVKKDSKLAPLALRAIQTVMMYFNGSDRYMLETINIAAGEQKAELAKALIESADFNPAQFPARAVTRPEAGG